MKKKNSFILGSILVAASLIVVSSEATWQEPNIANRSYEANDLFLDPDVTMVDDSRSIVTTGRDFLNDPNLDTTSQVTKTIQNGNDNLVDTSELEPATLLLFGIGIAGFSGVISIRSKKNNEGYWV